MVSNFPGAGMPRWAASSDSWADIIARIGQRARDGAQMPSNLVTMAIAAATVPTRMALMRAAVSAAGNCPQVHDSTDSEPGMSALIVLAQQAPLVAELETLCADGAGLAGLLLPSPLGGGLDKALVREYGGDPRTSRAREGVRALALAVGQSVERRTQALQDLLRPLLRGPGRAAALGWLARCVQGFEIRLRVRDETLSQGERHTISESHGPALNLVRLLMLLTAPLVRSPEKLQSVDVRYWLASSALVLDDPALLATRAEAEETTRSQVLALAEAEGVDEATAQQLHEAIQLSIGETPAPFTLTTEMFFTTLRGLHVCLFPAIEGMHHMMAGIRYGMPGLTPNTPEHAAAELHMHMVIDRWEMALNDPRLLESMTQFYLATAVWLHGRLLAEPETTCLTGVPMFVITDIAVWLTHVSSHSETLRAATSASRGAMPALVALACALLTRAAQRSPVTTSKIIAMLRALIVAGGPSSPVSPSPAARDGFLAYEVLDHPKSQQALGPALLRAFVAVDMVEGLDVDKEDFDKYTVKHDMALLLRRLWLAVPHRAAITSMAVTALEDFVKSLLVSLLFVSDSVFNSLRLAPYIARLHTRYITHFYMHPK